MITIIPSIEILKAVVDDNIMSPASNIRRIAFDNATDLMSQSSINVLIEGILYDRIKQKLNPDHRKFFESGIYRIDDSAKDVTDFDVIKAIKWIANSESNSKKVVIISENTDDFKSVCKEESIKCLTPNQFLELVGQAQKLHKAGIFSTLDDSLMAIFFILDK